MGFLSKNSENFSSEGDVMEDGMDSIVNEFLVESYENLDQLDADLVDLEQNPTDQGLLAGIFRTIHTIKGTCGFLGFSKLESIAHVGENLLSKLREGELSLSAEITSALLSMIDAIREILSNIESNQDEGAVDYSELIKTLTLLNEGETGVVTPAMSTPKESPAPENKTKTSAENTSEPEAESAPVVDEGMESIIKEFLVESYENLDQLDGELVDLEQNPTDESLLASIFRTIHTIKGTCGFLGYTKLESIAHVGENLLSQMREGKLALNAEITSALLAMVDAIRNILSYIEEDRTEGSTDYSGLVDTLTRLNNGESVGTVAPVSAEESTPAPAEESKPAVSESASPDVKESEATPVAASGDKGSAPARQDRGVSETSIRVDVGLLDTLMNLVGELVLARNQIVQYSSSEKDPKFSASSQTLNMITTELQEGVMKTRMQPIGNIWDKFPRVVRDLALSCGKKVKLEMDGKDTELDKTLIEAIKDPLTHIVRNAVDHGIESPEKRVANGKNEEGTLSLKAFHEGGQVNIEICDDGGGIDPEKIKNKAIDKNVVTSEQAARMNDRELVNLIFAPGFSTAEKVTNVSGRGVGMDVVRTNIEKIGGTVDIQGTVNMGTTLKVKIPLTLAIIPALIVTCGENRYAIPQVNLLELVRLEGEDAKNGIEMIQGTPVYRLRGNLLPLVYLHKELQVPCASENSDILNIVVLQAGDRHFGLVVYGINDTEEIVVKPLGSQLKGITAFAGATIMGDGKVALILDGMGLAQKAGVVTEGRQQLGQGAKDMDDSVQGDKQTLLIFGIGDTGRMAIPLSMVARLEEFKRSSVEQSGDQTVVQYRGEIMPLVFLSKTFSTSNGNGNGSESEMMPAVVYTQDGKSIGIIVDRIIDIVEETITVKKESNRSGILGTVVVQNKVTDLVDLEAVVTMGVLSQTTEYDQVLVPQLTTGVEA